MSEEEKKSFEELKKEINKPLEVPEDKCNTFILYNIDNAKIILNLIEKQQKEIENLKELMAHKNGYTKQLEEDLFENASNYVVNKDKIREKIKDLEDNMILFTNDKEKFNRYKYARDILEKLLKEE